MHLRSLLVLMLLGSVLAACGGGDIDDGGAITVPASPTSPVMAPSVTATVPLATPTTGTTATSTSQEATPEATAKSTVTATTASGTPVADTTIPDSPVGNRIAWVLDELNAQPLDLTSDDVNAAFSPLILTQVPAEQILAGFEDVAALGPFEFNGFWEPPTSTSAAGLLVSSSGDEYLMFIEVEVDEPYRLNGLNFQPVPRPVELASWDEFDTQLAALASDVAFMAAEVSEGTCEPVHSLNPETSLAIGSAFKLYVLGELARKIETGEAAWDDEIGINDAWKSLPSGILQDEQAGTTLTLQRYAELMISISDNTATDHLLRVLGRDNVETIQATMGHREPERNLPFLTTRELFVLKLVIPQDQLAAYIAANDDEQRAFLESDVANAGLSINDATDWSSPRQIDTIEWFASPEDLCQAMIWLDEQGSKPGMEPVRDVLSMNPGVPLDEETWTWVGFKGGSEPGVLNLTLLLEREDGRKYVVTVGLNDGSQLVDEGATVQLLMGALNLLATGE